MTPAQNTAAYIQGFEDGKRTAMVEIKRELAKQEVLITSNSTELEKQEQGESVAMEKVYETIIHWDEGGGKRSRRELARRIEALYITPQQRKPLTDEQILNVARDHYNPNQRAEISFARAIEAAHGIAPQGSDK